MRPGWIELIESLKYEAEYYNRNAQLFKGEARAEWCLGKEDMALQILAFVIGKKGDMKKEELLLAADREVRILSSIPERSGSDIGPEALAASLNT
jgi:hypothetical protein